MSEPFIAEIRIFPYSFAPRGWAYCDGQLLPIAQNTALFSLIGTTYGGDGRTTLGLPNMMDRAPMHPGRGPGLTSRKLGQRGGTTTVDLTAAQIPDHTHEMAVTKNPATSSNPEWLYPSRHMDDMKGFVYKNNPTLDTQFSYGTIATTGGSQGHENMQPCLTVAFCIALVGLYPSRS